MPCEMAAAIEISKSIEIAPPTIEQPFASAENDLELKSQANYML